MVHVQRGEPPGILTLLDRWDSHRGAFEYDWRTRFGLGLSDIPSVMDWGEAWRLTKILAADPSSQVCAGLAGWTHPISREDMVLRALFDLTHKVNAKNPKAVKPMQRPWDPQPRKYGTTVSIEQWKQLKEANLSG